MEVSLNGSPAPVNAQGLLVESPMSEIVAFVVASFARLL
jgi:hypothetical protein